MIRGLSPDDLRSVDSTFRRPTKKDRMHRWEGIVFNCLGEILSLKTDLRAEARPRGRKIKLLNAGIREKEESGLSCRGQKREGSKHTTIAPSTVRPVRKHCGTKVILKGQGHREKYAWSQAVSKRSGRSHPGHTSTANFQETGQSRGKRQREIDSCFRGLVR